MLFLFHVAKLRRRTVIDINTAECIGYVSDIEIDEMSGRITSVIVRKSYGFLASLFRIGEMSVPWHTITAMSDEFVLVKSFDFSEMTENKE